MLVHSVGKCYGGLARLRRAVQDIKKTRENVLWLNAGDFFQGTIWYTQFKWEVVSKFSNMLDFDAMTLGNHEFDDSIAGVVPFLKNQTCKVVVSNLNDSLVPAMKGLTVKSAKFQVGEKTVGVVGYLTPDTKFIADPEELIILDEIESLKPVVSQLHQEGVEIIVALGHSGYEKDQEIAASVPHLDVVVGAHTHSFLFSPSEDHPNPSNNQIRGPYPTIVNNPAGHKTIVLQAYAFTKVKLAKQKLHFDNNVLSQYLGNVDLKFSSDGSLDSWSGSPILLDSTFPKDPEVEEELKPYKVKLDEISKVVIGSAAKTLLHSRDRESLMGNFVTDAMLRPWENKTMPDGSKIRKYQPNCHVDYPPN